MSPPRAMPSTPSGAAGDEATRIALTLVTLLITAVVSGMLGFAVLQSRGGGGTPPTPPDANVSAEGFPAARLQFAGNDDTLPPDAQGALAAITESARGDSARVVRIQAFRAADLASAQRAAQRAERVRHALEADGVPRDQLVIDPPALGSSSRVDVRVD